MVELLEVWPFLTPLIMIAIVMRQHSTIWELLHSGKDPVVTMQHQDHSFNALTLVTLATNNEGTCSWTTPTCMHQNALPDHPIAAWSPYDLKAHQLFPPPFRRGVRHILGLMLHLIEMAAFCLNMCGCSSLLVWAPREWGLKALKVRAIHLLL